MSLAVTPLCHDALCETISEFVEHGTENERVLATLLFGVYTRSCEMPRVIAFINEWSLGALNER